MSPTRLPIYGFVLALGLTGVWGADVFLNPQYPQRVDGSEIIPDPVTLDIPESVRKEYSKSVADTVIRLNLFRPERKPFVKPKPPPPPKVKPKEKPKPVVARIQEPTTPVVQKPVVPPPELRLTGVMLFGNQKVAFFEGTYSKIVSGGLARNLAPKRGGYKVGEFFGDYQIQIIEKDQVVLGSLKGKKITLRLFTGTKPDSSIPKPQSHPQHRASIKKGVEVSQKVKVGNTAPIQFVSPHSKQQKPGVHLSPSNNNPDS